jgi:hypothetical protein
MRGFNVIHYLPDHAPLDVDPLSEPVDIFPFGQLRCFEASIKFPSMAWTEHVSGGNIISSWDMVRATAIL